MSSRTLLAVSVTHDSPGIASQVRAAITAGAEVVELRVDLIGDIEAVRDYLRDERADVPHILTIRSSTEGGAWEGDDAARIALIESLGLELPGYVDIELATWERSANLRQKVGLVCARTDRASVDERPKNALIMSCHDFEDAASLAPLLTSVGAAPAAVRKVAVMARDATDALHVLNAQRQQAPFEAILIAMGPAGVATRVLARKFNAMLTFATVDVDSASAPGQLTLDALRHDYHWDEISPDTRVFGVLGWPVQHSLSPRVHTAAMRAAGIDGVYVPFPVRETYADFVRFMDYADAHPELDLQGFSVTIPHKAHALRWLTAHEFSVSDVAARCGAVNTLVRTATGWHGDNTDVVGVRHALSTHGPLSGLRGTKVHLIGAGGAARSVLAALSDLGVTAHIFARRHDQAEELTNAFGGHAQPWADRAAACDLLINATPIGMLPATEESPVPVTCLGPETLVFDTVYNPRQTRLLRDALARGCATIAGDAMFIGQAAAQFELWHQRPASLPQFQTLVDRLLAGT